jgi:hypothetical protein
MLTFRTSSVNLWHLGVDLSDLRCKKRFRGGHIYTFFLLLILGSPYSSYTVYRRSLLEIERPGSAECRTLEWVQNSNLGWVTSLSKTLRNLHPEWVMLLVASGSYEPLIGSGKNSRDFTLWSILTTEGSQLSKAQCIHISVQNTHIWYNLQFKWTF